MNAVVLYGSSRGSTRQAVARLSSYFEFPFQVFDVKRVEDVGTLGRYDLFLVFSPTYGDAELQPDMEKFITGFKLDMSNKYYAICELGNYYGYDDFEFGAMKIIRYHLDKLHGKELIKPLSMDSLPKKDWEAFVAWCKQVNDIVLRAGPHE